MEFDDECLAFNKELETLTSMLPSVNLVEETEERLMERIALLQVFMPLSPFFCGSVEPAIRLIRT